MEVRGNRRGYVLAHVLVATIVAVVLVMSLVTMLMSRYQATARATEAVQGVRQAEASMNRLLASWNAASQYCASISGYSCTGAPGTGQANCACVCTPTATGCTSFPNCTADGTPSYPGKCPAQVTAAWDASAGRCKITMTTCQ